MSHDGEELTGCDIDFISAAQTEDADLPETIGGLDDDACDLDGCSLDFTAAAPTPDEDLPETIGGVE